MPAPSVDRSKRRSALLAAEPTRVWRTDASHLTDDDWINAARDLLIKEGAEAIKIDRIAKSCGVSRGGFYWRFKNRDALLDRLLQDWVDANQLIITKLKAFAGSAERRIYFAASLWQRETRQAEYDLAVRSWARSSSAAAAAIASVDRDYLTIVEAAFIEVGHAPYDAAFRAHILYNHYLGLCTSMTIGKGSTLDTNWELARFLID